MTTKIVCMAALALVAIMPALPALGHHSFAAEFDSNKPVKLTGTVTKVEWTNPHVWFYMDVKDDTGKVINWAMEMGGPNGLLRAGWTRDTMKAGDVITVDGFRARNGRSMGNATSVILTSTGRRLFAASSAGQ